jgi:hypothetical protein
MHDFPFDHLDMPSTSQFAMLGHGDAEINEPCNDYCGFQRVRLEPAGNVEAARLALGFR